jgi:3-carboxy-cis,cis-muconate cycloisomerase
LDSLATTEPLAAVFGDVAVFAAMLRFEVGLARVEARLGLIPAAAAESVARAATVEAFDAAAIARDARASASIVIPFVAALAARVHARDPGHARFVHWGATSQDVFDTALVLCLAEARPLLAADHVRLVRALVALSDAHADTVMLGRTLLQAATPITFGLKVAGWAAALSRSWTGVSAAFDSALVLQCGGAAGTLASLGADAAAVERALADELDLSAPDAPWHAHRDRLAALVCALAIHTGELGKMATDLALLMQDEIGEVTERGGASSTMPQKRNPAGSAVVIAAATRAPGLAAAFLGGLMQAHERAVGAWQAEAPTIADAVQTCGSALSAAADVIDGLTVKPDRMRANIIATGGVIFAERVSMLIRAQVGRETASALVAAAVADARASGRPFGDVVRATPDLARLLPPEALETIDAPDMYLGAAHEFRARLLATARASLA